MSIYLGPLAGRVPAVCVSLSPVSLALAAAARFAVSVPVRPQFRSLGRAGGLGTRMARRASRIGGLVHVVMVAASVLALSLPGARPPLPWHAGRMEAGVVGQAGRHPEGPAIGGRHRIAGVPRRWRRPLAPPPATGGFQAWPLLRTNQPRTGHR